VTNLLQCIEQSPFSFPSTCSPKGVTWFKISIMSRLQNTRNTESDFYKILSYEEVIKDYVVNYVGKALHNVVFVLINILSYIFGDIFIIYNLSFFLFLSEK
jgi:hypothetical protein